MKFSLKIGVYFFLGLILSGCNFKSSHPPIKYSFFVAGHTYGSPMQTNIGLYPPFKELTESINENSDYELGVFTGDIVRTPDIEHWTEAINDINNFNVPIHIARGNHDGTAIFDSLFHKSYYTFNQYNDLFIILAPASWNIKGQQLDFLDSVLNVNQGKVKNTFIFAHELIWWSPEKYPDVKVNYLPHYPGHTNYWEDVHPLFKKYNQTVYLFSGDVGCSDQVTPYTIKEKDNVKFFASGMGSGNEDNFIKVDILVNDSVLTEFIKF
jgi:hypothetical protein